MSTPTSTLPPVLFPLPSGPLSEVIAEVLRPGLQQLQKETPDGHALLAPWAEPILERMAWKALTDGLGADGNRWSAEPYVEAELKRQSRPGAPGGPARRRQLMALLANVDVFLWLAGWLGPKRLIPDTAQMWFGFSILWLPSILAGKRLGAEPSQAAAYRSALGADPSWALVGWAAVRQGDSAERWIDLFLEETDPVQWFLRIVPTACVLAAVQPGAVPEAKLLAAYQGCVQGLCWFSPRYMQEGYGAHPLNEPATGWQLPREPWLQAVLALASLPTELQAVTALLPAGFWKQPPSIFVPLISLIGLAGPDARPKALTPKTVAGLLLPQRALAEGLWDREFWELLNGNMIGSPLLNMLVAGRAEHYTLVGSWQKEVCLPVLLAASESSLQAVRLLALPQERGLWFFLLSQPGLAQRWNDAFLRLLTPKGSLLEDAPVPTDAEIGDAWAAAMIRRVYLGSHGSAVAELLEPLRDLISARGLWPAAQESLRQRLINEPPQFFQDRPLQNIAAALLLFAWAELTESDWEQLLLRAKWQGGKHDRLFQAAGAPQNLLLARLAQELRSQLHGQGHPLDQDIAERAREVLGEESLALVEAVLDVLTEVPDGRLALSAVTWPDGPWLNRLLALQGSALHGKVQLWLIHLAKFAQDVRVRSQAAIALIKQQALASGGTP